MAQQKLTLMISSRSDAVSIEDGTGGKMTLREARLRLKEAIEGENFLGRGLMQVWINEAESGDGDGNSWDECIEQAEKCDLFISLYDGSAGWAPTGGGIGICHAEFNTALRLAPGKVKVIRLKKPKVNMGNPVDVAYLEDLGKANRFATFAANEWPDLLDKFRSLVREMVLKAAHEGARDSRKSGGNVGLALDWSRMTFAERSKAIATTIAGTLRAGQNNETEQENLAVVSLDEKRVLLASHGAPRSLSVSASRELVGQPFLLDHTLVEGLGDEVIGPIHLIGCPKTVTEGQAVSLLGFPDFTVVEGSFGVYAADNVQRIQLCLLANCSDPGSTRNSVDRFLEWLKRSGELPLMLRRAGSRRNIINAIRAG